MKYSVLYNIHSRKSTKLFKTFLFHLSIIFDIKVRDQYCILALLNLAVQPNTDTYEIYLPNLFVITIKHYWSTLQFV